MLIVAANVRADPVFLYVNPHNHQLTFTKERADATKFEDDTQAAIACAVFSLKFSVANPRVEAA